MSNPRCITVNDYKKEAKHLLEELLKKGLFWESTDDIIEYLAKYLMDICKESEREVLDDINIPKYLVRPNDFHIFEIDDTNGCYRSYSTREITRLDGTRPNAQSHFTFKNLVENNDFIPIDESELEKYESKHKIYLDYMRWHCRPDGHGGKKGGTFEEYLEALKSGEYDD